MFVELRKRTYARDEKGRFAGDGGSGGGAPAGRFDHTSAHLAYGADSPGLKYLRSAGVQAAEVDAEDPLSPRRQGIETAVGDLHVAFSRSRAQEASLGIKRTQAASAALFMRGKYDGQDTNLRRLERLKVPRKAVERMLATIPAPGTARPNPLASMPAARGVRNVARERAAGPKAPTKTWVNGRQVPTESLRPRGRFSGERRSAASRNAFGTPPTNVGRK